MDLLVIGGGRFVGKHFVRSALERGHRVTLFNRGNHPLPHPDARHISGDRNHDLDKLAEGTWDAVLDTCGYVPRHVLTAARSLAGRVGHYAFISTISVYADQSTPYQDEDAPLAELDDPDTEEVGGQTYGGLKVLCERALDEHFPGERLVVRPGLIVGPDDPTDRFTYWPVRVARGGEVLAPTTPGMPVQWIDVRDLATWLVDLLEAGTGGTFNAVSEPDRFSFGRLLEASREASGSDARLTWVRESFLLEHEVQPFMELPLWIPGDAVNFSRIDSGRARAAGLTARPLEETVRDTLAWYRESGGHELKAGLSEAREAELLAAWRMEEAGG